MRIAQKHDSFEQLNQGNWKHIKNAAIIDILLFWLIFELQERV